MQTNVMMRLLSADCGWRKRRRVAFLFEERRGSGEALQGTDTDGLGLQYFHMAESCVDMQHAVVRNIRVSGRHV